MTDTGFVVSAARQARLTTVYRAGAEGFGVADAAGRSLFSRRPRAWSGGGGWDMVGHGGLVTTAGDFFRFLQMILNGGELEGVRVLSRHTVALDAPQPARDARLARAHAWRRLRLRLRHRHGRRALRRRRVAGPDVVGGVHQYAGTGSTPEEQLVGLYLSQMLPFPYLDLMGTVMRLGYQALE